MNKVAVTYWDSSVPQFEESTRMQTRTRQTRETTTPQWFAFAVIATITFMVCLTVNIRSFSELREEVRQNEELNSQIQTLTDQNLLIRNEINGLKTDPKIIEREARKLGMGRADEKIFVPTD